MIACRVCRSPLGPVAFAAPAPGMTSLSTLLSSKTEVWVCEACGHAQSPDLPDVQAFYDHEYKISLQSEDHDQLYERRGDVSVFRTDRQAELVLELDLPPGAKVLDFGAAKAATLKKVVEARPDIVPHVFDVSRDYEAFWQAWIAPDHQATYDLPDRWRGRFDAITAHFVLEHVAEPIPVLKSLRDCLAPGGRLFVTMPDPLGNPGDLLVVDHLNHFTASSVTAALAEASLVRVPHTTDGFRGAHVIVASRTGEASEGVERDEGVRQVVECARASLGRWERMLAGIDAVDVAGRKVAIYGAGFYGTLIASRLNDKPVCFLDRNPHLAGLTHVGSPVLYPEDCPADVEVLFAGLNPLQARSILPAGEPWIPVAVELIYLDA